MATSRAHPISQKPDAPAASRGEVIRICGDLLDWKIAAIVGTEATAEELEEAVAWIQGQSDIMGKERKRLAGRVAAIYDILTADEEPDDYRPAGPGH